MVKVFKFNEHDKIEFTQKELEALLNEVYDAGYTKGYNRYTWVSPYYSTTCTTASNSSITASDSPLKDRIEITY